MARQLRINTRQNARKSLTRIIREFDADPEANHVRFKAMLHGFNTLLAYDKVAEETELLERIEALEQRVQEMTDAD